MKRSFKSVLGVTLLEIMLVLAIAAMVIVMSIRYYQSASLNQKVSVTMNNITGIVAATESYMSATGTLAGLTSAVIVPYLPSGKMPNSGWGVQMTIKGGAATSFDIGAGTVPADACKILTQMISQNSKMKATACGTTSTDFTVTVTE